MSLTRSIAHNTIIQAGGRIISTLLTLAAFILVARHLGVDRYGELTTATAFLQVFGLVVDLGLYIYLTSKLGEPDVDESSVLSNVFTLRLLSAVAILGLAPLIVLAFPYPPVVKVTVVVLTISSLSVTLTQVLAGVFQKALQTARFIGAEVLGRIILLGLTVAAVRSGVGIVGIAWTVTLGSLTTLVATFLAANRLTKIRLSVDLAAWKRILVETWPIALSIAFNVVYFKADTIILSLYRPAHDVGIYGAPFRFLEALISVPAMIAGLLTPLLSSVYTTDRARFHRFLQRGFELLLAAAVPLVIGAQFVADDVMRLVAPEFEGSGVVLKILMLATFSIFLGYLFSNAIVVVGKQRTIVWAYAVVALASLILCLWLIPSYSYLAAAWIAFVIQSAIALVSAVVVLRASRTRIQLGVPARIVAAGLVMAGLMWVGRDLPWVANATLGSAAYFAAAFGLGAVDRQTLREIFSRSSD